MLARSSRNFEVELLLRAKLGLEIDVRVILGYKRIIEQARKLNFDLPCYVLPTHCVRGDVVSQTQLNYSVTRTVACAHIYMH